MSAQTNPLDLAQFAGSSPGQWPCLVADDPDARLAAAAPLLLAEVVERRAQDAKVRELMEAVTEAKTRERFDPKWRRMWDALAACYAAGVAGITEPKQVKP